MFSRANLTFLVVLPLFVITVVPQLVWAEENYSLRLAQSSGEEGENLDQMFESMEEDTDQKDSEGSLIDRLWENKTLKVVSWNDGYLRSASDDRTRSANLIGTEQLYFQSQLNFEGDVFFVETWYEWSNLESAYEQDSILKQSENERRNPLHVNEIYYSWAQGNYDLSVGKKLIESGYATMYSPSDRYNRSDLTDPVHPRSEGVWEAAVDYYHENATTSFHFMPAYEPSRSPPGPSRWSAPQSGGTFNTNFNTFGGTEEYPDAHSDDWQYLLQHERTYAGWDVFGQVFSGKFGPVVIQEGGQNRQEYFSVLTLATGFRVIQDRWKYYGELLYQDPYDDVDDAFAKGVLGAKYSFDESVRPYGLKKVDITAEYAQEEITDAVDNPDVLFSTRDTRPGRRSYLFKSTFKQSSDLRYILASEIDRDKKSEFYGFGLKHNYTGNLNINAWAEFFNADSDSQLSHWSDNDRLIVSVEYFL